MGRNKTGECYCGCERPLRGGQFFATMDCKRLWYKEFKRVTNAARLGNPDAQTKLYKQYGRRGLWNSETQKMERW